jgi:hypothetical protein
MIIPKVSTPTVEFQSQHLLDEERKESRIRAKRGNRLLWENCILGPIIAGNTMAGKRYSGSAIPPCRAVILVAMKSISRPPMKKDITAPTKPDTERSPRLWIFQ